MNSRVAFTGSVLLGLVALTAGLTSYYHMAVKIGEYDVPTLMGWFAAGVFGLFAVLLMRTAHA